MTSQVMGSKNKNIYIRIIFLLPLLFATVTFSFGQIEDSLSTQFSSPSYDTTSITADFNDIHLNLNKELLDQLVPIDSFIALAQIYNPGIKAQEALIEAGKAEVKLGRREWQNSVFAYFNENAGNQTLFYNTNQDPSGTQSQSVSTGYRLGISVNIPLYFFSARNTRIDIFKNELQVRKETKEKLKQDLARIVVAEYNSMMSTHRILLIASNSRGSARMLMDMANRQFQQGDITIGDYTSVMGLASKAESDYEVARHDFYTWYQSLEQLIGVRIDQLVRKK